jgi:hypothetical protein
MSLLLAAAVLSAGGCREELPPKPHVKPRKGIKMINRDTARRSGIAAAGEISGDTILLSKD